MTRSVYRLEVSKSSMAASVHRLDVAFPRLLEILIWQGFGRISPQLVLEPQIVRDHGNKLRIRGLSSVVLDRVSKIRVQCIHVAPIPRRLDSVADGKKSIGLFIGLNTLDLLCCLILAHRNLSVKRQTYEYLETKNEHLSINYPTGKEEERIKKITSFKKVLIILFSTIRTHE